MRILIVTTGSRGDVAPFTGLGRRLMDAGYRVAVVAHPTFAGLIESCGLEYRPLPGDPEELIRARAHATSPQETRALMAAFVDGLADGVADAVAGGADLLLTAFAPSPLSRTAGEAYGVPVLGTYLTPAFATREFPLPGPAGGDDLGPEGNLAAGRERLRSAERLFSGAVARMRERLGLPGTTSPEPLGHTRPVVHGYSPLVVPRPADWPAPVDVAGFWWPARPAGWRPPAELVDFLQAGPAPVFIGFGSMASGEGERLGELVTAAVRRAGVRAVVQAGWAGLEAAGDGILSVGDLPHDWLFPHVAAAVHHAGAGTTGAALRAGVPAVPVPVMADQPFWAARLHRLGVAPEPVPFADLTPERLATAITAALAEPVRHRAAAVGSLIAAEDGAGTVLSHIARIDENLSH
ncbi:glycosyltransferase [Streptomyces sp. FH025]|uniref:glycosyltransferase n=1 Tax=Streptomyces sp. FH025 TaxID=2815937 RepID=UPI001A9E106C|nr:glycosyltransferase [Streptomyces sp. FH025]MBO1413980.1 glycosyltransferase family 1 protein [Streptomyces sp. FH025]